MARLRGLNLHNGALVAMDYRTGDILAYVGSAGYYRQKNARFDPKYDAAGQGRRQPGSAWKPIVYATGSTPAPSRPGTVLLDITTPFGPGWAPKDADSLDRGPVLVREALQYSLNIPAIRALDRTGVKTVASTPSRPASASSMATACSTMPAWRAPSAPWRCARRHGGRLWRLRQRRQGDQPRHILKVEDSDGTRHLPGQASP